MNFSVQIEDDNENSFDDFSTKQNENYLELHNWQTRAIKFFFKENSALFEVCTGAGKTYCAIEILKEIWKIEPELKVLIVVPKNVIMETGWYSELYNAGISLTKIGVYYGRIKETAQVTITNMQNIERINLKNYEVVIWDEIHNYCTPRMIKFVEQPFKYKIGLSATLERGDNKHFKLYEIFNYNIFQYNPKQALEEDILNPFNFINIGVEMDSENYDYYDRLTQEINLLIKSGGGFNKIMRGTGGIKYKLFSKLNERKQLVNNYPRKFDVIKIICLKHKNDKILVFNQFNEQTNKCYWYLLDVGINARIVHSGITADKREEALTDFKNDKFNVLLTSKVLDEGYNLPKIDTAIIMAGDSTAKQTIQRMGRVLRKKEKTSNLYQLYVKDTIEEDYAWQRAKLFKELCSKYEQYNYKINTEFEL